MVLSVCVSVCLKLRKVCLFCLVRLWVMILVLIVIVLVRVFLSRVLLG